MKAEDIRDEETLRRWLRERPEGTRRQDAVQIAQRCACRALPFVGSQRDLERGLPLQFWLAHLTSGIAAVVPAPETQLATAARFLATGAYSTADADLDADAAGSYARVAGYMVEGTNAEEDVWHQIRLDAALISVGRSSLSFPLWSATRPEWFEKAERAMRIGLQNDPPGTWDFWLRWWDGVLSGQQIDWALQEAVALMIKQEVWQAEPGAVAEAIRGIEKGLHRLPETQSIDHLLARIAPAERKTLVQFSQSVWAHKHDLPPTLDAVLGYCSLEIERLQARNYRDDDDRDECRRQIGVLLTIHEAVSRLSQSIIVERPMTPTEAELPEKLTRIYVKSFKEWPRKNADDLVDSSYRAALMGATVLALPMIGVPVTIAAGFGAMLFGGKKVADAIKAAKDVARPAP